jgi:hypothetical protein
MSKIGGRAITDNPAYDAIASGEDPVQAIHRNTDRCVMDARNGRIGATGGPFYIAIF